MKLDFYQKWIVITGASSGLGRSLALLLAKKEKANLILVARREEKLALLKKELQADGETRVEIIPADLTDIENVNMIFKRAIEIGDVFALINNAGMTYYGEAAWTEIELFDRIIQVNFKALMHLSLRFLTYFQKRNQGAILNITSMGGLLPLPYQGVYSASKAAAQYFTECLAKENRNKGIVISSVAPGGMATEMIINSGLNKKIDINSRFNMNPDRVAKKAISAFKKGKLIYIPGISNSLLLFLCRLFPRKTILSVIEKVYRLKDFH